MNNEVVEYDDLIEDQVAAIEAMLRGEDYDSVVEFNEDRAMLGLLPEAPDCITFGDDIDQPCKGCGTPVSTPKELLPITVFCTYQCFALKG